MKQITEINAKEIIDMLARYGVECDELYFQGNKWSYSGGFLEGESKWCLRHCVDADDRYSKIGSLEIFVDRGRICAPPCAAIEYLACKGEIPTGEYLIWCSW